MPTRPTPLRVTRPRATIYLRQSTYREESISLESQEHICREYADRNGYDVVRVESDPGISGRTWQRRGVQAAMSTLEADEADVVILWKWSRLSRNRRDWAVAADRADLAGGRIESATEPIDTNSAAGRFQRGVMVEMAAFESDRIGETWKETHEFRRRNGQPPTGGPRFGYLRDEHGHYTPDPVTGPLLADAYRWYLAGAGFTGIRQRLNEAGAHSSKGEWSTRGLTAMLDSGFGAGLLLPSPKAGGRRELPPWDRDYAQGAQEAVIDAAMWDGYVSARRARFKKPVRTGHRYMLTGLVQCGDCGGPMSGCTLRSVPSYVCTRAIQKRDRPRLSVAASRVDNLVDEWVLNLASEITEQEKAIERTASRRKRADSAHERLRRDLAKADDRLVQLALRLADGKLSDSAYGLAAAKVEADRAALEARLSLTIANPVQDSAPAEIPADLAMSWPHTSPDERAQVLRPLIRHVAVFPREAGSNARRIEIVPAWAD